MSEKPLGIFHEHPDWFRPLFAELDRRGVRYERIDARTHFFDPAEESSPYGLVFNRMSPSAYLRGAGNAIFSTHAYLAHLDRLGVRVVNGATSYAYETSKARQLTLLQSLGLPYPKARVIHGAAQAPAAAEGLRFPVVVKANIGGSGAGIVRYDAMDALKRAAAEGSIDLGLDGTALVQEYVPARGGHITRVETLGGKYLYAINVFTDGASFNLCPADICQTADGRELAVGAACPAESVKKGLTVAAYTPPSEVIDAVERIVQAAQIDVGGIEYMADDRDGALVYYDVNALSNFVADAVNVVGFDPHARLADFLAGEAGL
jgi:hypothetical protein